MSTTRKMMIPFSIAMILCAACGSGSTGNVQVFVQPEDTIPDGLTPGTGDENIHDGWTVNYTKFIAVIGNVRAWRSSDPGDRLTENRTYVIDLMNVPAGGVVIAAFDHIDATRWDKFGFDMPNASDTALRAEGTSEADYANMVANHYSLHIAGTLTKADGQSCDPIHPSDCVAAPQITFDWGLQVGTGFDDCAPGSGDAGFAVPSGGTVQIKPTIHGDHWFFSNVTQGAEFTERRAQWIANADRNRDGSTTLDELRATRIADIFYTPPYNLSGAIIPLNTAYDYLEAQARTIGDYQGEGECPTRTLLQ